MEYLTQETMTSRMHYPQEVTLVDQVLVYKQLRLGLFCRYLLSVKLVELQEQFLTDVHVMLIQELHLNKRCELLDLQYSWTIFFVLL